MKHLEAKKAEAQSMFNPVSNPERDTTLQVETEDTPRG